MKKIILLAFISLVFYTADCLAGVTFIVDSAQHSSRSASTNSQGQNTPGQPNNSERCVQLGYNKNSCSDGSYPNLKCPYDQSYFKYCCPTQFENNFSQCN